MAYGRHDKTVCSFVKNLFLHRGFWKKKKAIHIASIEIADRNNEGGRKILIPGVPIKNNKSTTRV